MVKVAQGHEGPPEYDHHALMRANADKQKNRRDNRNQRLAALWLSLLEESLAATRDIDMGDLNLAELLTEIEATNADVMYGDQYCAYCGMSKQCTATSKTVRGQPGRFLWESTQRKGSTNIPIVQWASTCYYGRTALNRGDLDWHDF